MTTLEPDTDKLRRGDGAGELPAVVITFPTRDAAERFTYIAEQLAGLPRTHQMRLLPLAVAIRDFLRLAVSVEMRPGEEPAGTRKDR